ncbi:MAG: 4-phosphoerythronate dehydrogenase [Candidatus Saccharibacteria bacterium]|nr:4-phosphoerythronate dehydrogenase [Moraxellaceae bacterium]
MYLVADENLSLTEYFFSSFGTVKTYAGRGITVENLIDAEVLLVRSVTKVTPQLLQAATDLSASHKRIGFVGSATIGTDHLDVAGLQASGVTVANAPGCNAQAVAEYVVTAILTLQPEGAVQAGFTVGIVGLGNVGQRLGVLAKRLGWRVMGVDPFVIRDDIEQMQLREMLPQVDVVSLHVPITNKGQDQTYHLMDEETFAFLKPNAMLINSARGAVIAEAALLADFAHARAKGVEIRSVILDVFEHEPKISARLLDDLALATPHIAGYSLEGKAKGTEMIYQAFCQWQAVSPTRTLENMLPTLPQLFNPHKNLIEQLPALLSVLYPIQQDDAALRACLRDDEHLGESFVDAESFDRLRKEYPLRREWSSYGDQG